MLAPGCPNAVNGDGGGSAYLWPHNGWSRKMGRVHLLFIKEDAAKKSTWWKEWDKKIIA
ncbi:hypothetical protein PAT3040_06125 [Paenibacillus agaridevorans]|uniref:Uncharacterized protein n=1 Tax=Paenibacillus agaridevorans TaxID=171404 RepID=A0A2R5F537_9BACL|nr:hypothetical protein PAT3040_06125 [Paenibacillus agaridevorans]